MSMCDCGNCCNPPPEAEALAQLNPGDEILVEAGRGMPEQEEDTLHIVASVGGYSVLTADGVCLGCKDAPGVKPTGRKCEVVLSDEAERILRQVALRQATAWW